MSKVDKVIAGTAFEIVARSFSSGDSSDRNSFRIKNLTRSEAMEFVRLWQLRRADRSLELVRLVVASDSHEEFPKEFRADPQFSITHYRNNNDDGLVYIETKVESDEQGLKNLFTLRDVNFLDGTFDDDEGFLVPEEMVRQALHFAGSRDPRGNELLRDRLIEVLRGLNDADMTVPVRKFAGFVVAAADTVVSGLYSPEETNTLVGRCLVYLDMFPDEQWRLEAGRVSRRLSLNLLRSELADTPSSDLDAEKTAGDCIRTKFVDEEGTLYEQNMQAEWRVQCSEYCKSPSSERRVKLPYRIFEQVFSKDVKGLPLGQRVAEEIADHPHPRKLEFDQLAVETGLNSRSLDAALKLLESEPSDASALPLRDLLSKQTLRRVEKLASPAVERVQNPLIKLAQVVKGFRDNTDLEDGNYCIKIRAGGISDQHLSTLGLFAFLYGPSLKEIEAGLADAAGSMTLEVDDRLTRRYDVPPLRVDADPGSETFDARASEEDEGTVWLPIPLEFVLVNLDDGEELESELSIEWLPEDWPYLAVFWISVCGKDRGDVTSQIFARFNMTGEEWIKAVAHRLLPFASDNSRPIPEVIRNNSIIDGLITLRSKFRAEVGREGLSSKLLNDLFDEWASLLADARNVFVPDGDLPSGMTEFLNADCIQDFNGTNVLMLQSHPLKLRWIAGYLERSVQLASHAIEGSLRLNEQNEGLYLNWIQELSPHQQPSIHAAYDGHILFADGERGWTENFQKNASSGGALSGDKMHVSLVSEIVRQITAYLHAHPYKADGLRILVITGEASALSADIVQGVRKSVFKDISITMELVAPRDCWDEAVRQFELVDTDNRLTGAGSFFPPVQLNLHDFDKVRQNPESELADLVCDLAIVPQFLDDKITADAKTEDVSSYPGRFDPLLDDPTYIASGAGSSALWVSLRPKMTDAALSDWSTMVVRHERRNPVAADRPEANDFIDIRINFQNTARFFGTLHKCAHWVITVERHITREQIEKLETRPQVLCLRDGIGPGGLFTLIVSSNTGEEFVIDRLTRKLCRIGSLVEKQELAQKNSEKLAKEIYKEAREIAPRLTLDALGISRVTEEILGLNIARKVADKEVSTAAEEGFTAWISLDEHPEWFGSTNSMRADMIRLAVSLGNDGLSVDLLVLESKLRHSGYDAHGAEQVRTTLEMFDAVFPRDGKYDPMDGKLWRDKLLAAVDNVSDEAFLIKRDKNSGQAPRNSRVSEEISTLFRNGDFFRVNLSGLYSICEFSLSKEKTVEKYAADERVKIVKTGGGFLLSSELSSIEGPNEENSFDKSSEKAGGADGECTEVDEAVDVDPGSNDYGSPLTTKQSRLEPNELNRRYQLILDTFGQYGIDVSRTVRDVEHAVEGPASVLYRVKPGTGVDPKKLSAQHDALKLALELDASQNMRFVIDKGYVTIDVPKADVDRYFIDAKDLWSAWRRPTSGLSVPIGEDNLGNVVKIEFSSSNSPHLLIGGTTGSGKSEALNTILAGITEHYSPDEVRLQLIDPKGTELEHLSGSKHVDGEIGLFEEDAICILDRAVEEMQTRYQKFRPLKARDLDQYNKVSDISERLPRWLIVLDEYAELTSEPEAKRTIEASLKRLAAKARAAGIHVIIATQKPDATVISTTLRSNLPAQLALRVKSNTESRVIMDDPGAESLTGKGDAILKESGVLTRVQCAKV